MRIVVLASFNMDLVMRTARLPGPGETLHGDFAMYLGGKGFNQAVASRRLGAEVAVIGRVGDDDFGAAFLDALDAEGIDRAAVSVSSSQGTGVAAVVVDAEGENAILQSPRANRELSAADVAREVEAITGSDVAALQLETSMAAAETFVHMAADAGVRVLFNPAPAAPVPVGLLARCDVVAANAVEALALTGIRVASPDDAAAAAREIVAAGAGAAVVTLGAHGAVLHDGAHAAHHGTHDVPVVDTVGAGDAFCAAVAVALADGRTLDEAVRFGNAAGALACTRPGAEPSMPRRHEVEALITTGVSA
jgi:ribokinase